jgi:Uma2 family endonuclease
VLEDQLAGRGLEVSVEVTTRFAGFMPVPDLAVFAAKGQEGSIPGEDVQLVIEVSASTLDDDLGDTKQRYEAAGLPEYWVVDMSGRRILRFMLRDGAFLAAP